MLVSTVVETVVMTLVVGALVLVTTVVVVVVGVERVIVVVAFFVLVLQDHRVHVLCLIRTVLEGDHRLQTHLWQSTLCGYCFARLSYGLSPPKCLGTPVACRLFTAVERVAPIDSKPQCGSWTLDAFGISAVL